MGQERHVIKRQVIEVTLADKSAAWPIQQALSRLCQESIPALLDRHLSACGLSGELQRIEYLEVDLGELEGNRLEQELLEKLDGILPQALQQQLVNNPIRREGSTDRSHVELLEHFLREGHLPWWVDTALPRLPEQSFQALLLNDPIPLLRLISQIMLEPAPFQRLIRYFDNEQLTALFSAASRLPRQLTESLIHFLLSLSGLPHNKFPKPATDIRLALWQSLLQISLAGYPFAENRVEFFNTIIIRWASLLGIKRQALIESISQAVKVNHLAENEWLKIVKQEFSVGNSPESMDKEIQNGSISDFQSSAKESRRDPQPPSVQKINENFNSIEALKENDISSLSNATLAKDQPSDKPSTCDTVNPPTHKKDYNQSGRATNTTPQTYPNFNESGVIYITNAGLCILWPYLARFFESLDLTVKDRFIDRSAQHCAVCLLYYLATGDLEPPEYHLAFNKLLCGLETSDLFEAEKPLSDQQITACDQLLEAVINNAPVLTNMSHDGFRGSFLLRPGSLGTEAGSWLLRVERETYDVVLERFPWTWQWFKLPWMEFPVRVEW